MTKSSMSTLLLACAVMLSAVFTPAPAAAQAQNHFTYVATWAVPRSDWAAFEKQEKAELPMMQKLVADGTVIDWGDAAATVHQEDGYTHSEWFTATSRADILKALAILEASSTNSAYVSATKHHDVFLHTLAHGGKSASEAKGYLRVTFWQARPGDEDALESFVMKSIKPVLDTDVANGTLLMYNFDEQDIHTLRPGGYDLALLFRDGAAIDRFFSELTAAQKKNPGMERYLDSLTVEKDHRDALDRVNAYEHK